MVKHVQYCLKKLAKLNEWHYSNLSGVSVYINTLKTTLLLKVWFLTTLFKLQLIFVSMFMFIHTVLKLGWNQSRLHCIDIYDDNCKGKENKQISCFSLKCWRERNVSVLQNSKNISNLQQTMRYHYPQAKHYQSYKHI